MCKRSPVQYSNSVCNSTDVKMRRVDNTILGEKKIISNAEEYKNQ